MKIFLSITPVNCFRSPAVLERIRDGLQEGDTVAVLTREHSETLPDGVVYAADDWSAVVAACPDLAVFDNLVFEEPRGRIFRCWDWGTARYRNEPVVFLVSVLHELRDAGTKEVLLVSEEAEISDGWRDWMERHHVEELHPDPAHETVPRRRWWLSDTSPGVTRSPYRYREGRLLKPASPESPRLFKAEVLTPAAEALLALMAEYAAVRYEARNPENPRSLNECYEMCHEILVAFSGSGDPYELLTAMEDLYDIVSVHVDFSRRKKRWEITTYGGTPEKKEIDPWLV